MYGGGGGQFATLMVIIFGGSGNDGLVARRSRVLG